MNITLLRVLRFSEKKVRMKKNNNIPKEIGPQPKDLNVRAKTDCLFLTEKKKRKKRRGQIGTIFIFHLLLGPF